MPPRIVAPDATLTATLVVLVLGAGLLAADCVFPALRARSLVPVLAIAGGVLALPIEPFWDVNVLFTFASNTHPVALTAFGRDIPLYLAFIYPAFIGWLAGVAAIAMCGLATQLVAEATGTSSAAGARAPGRRDPVPIGG
jgi:hypothetical protein